MAYIKLEDAIEVCNKYKTLHKKENSRLGMAIVNDIYLDIENLPTADVEEVKHGEWIEKFKDGFWYYDCPFCDDGYVVMERDENKPNYCHNCGAKMRGDAE